MKLFKANKLYNAIVIDEATRQRTRELVADAEIPANSVPWDYDNGRYHILGKDLDNKYWPIRPAESVQENESPVDLYMAMHCAGEVQMVYGISMPWSEKLKVGIFAVLILLIVVFVFLIAASSGA